MQFQASITFRLIAPTNIFCIIHFTIFQFIQVVKEVDDHLIDSNMFLRSIILTNYNKRKSGGLNIFQISNIG